ncbi:MAG: thiolase domain-containing protein [Elusimicrobia bacterium]|nr:thiolase domain-containing protein [Elusimicrobiota bacterium]
MRPVAVIGVGLSPWGELWRSSLRDLFAQAALKAIKDSGAPRIDSLLVGCMSGGLFNSQEHVGALVADYTGLKGVPATRVESACASGGVAFRQGVLEVASGASDFVLVGGVEKMTDLSGDGATFALSTAADFDYEAYQGATFPALYALMARAHMDKYGTTREQLAMVAAKNHDNGLLNPNAQFKMKVSVQDVMNSVKVAEPLCLLDCSPITDGAAAVVLAPVELAAKLKKGPLAKVLGVGQAADAMALAQREDITRLEAAELAAQRAYKMAGKSPKDIDFAEVHDCFTIAEICAIEALGFCKPGQGGKFTEQGHTALKGSKPINTSGGLKSKGHPVGATGVAQIVELVEQLRGAAGERQLSKARVGLAQNMGGTCGSSVVSILGREGK